MPRYFFNVHGGIDCRDDEGTVLRDAMAARQEGLRFVGSLLAEQAMRVELGVSWTLEVADASGSTIMRLDVRS